jgi:hypothetical protein
MRGKAPGTSEASQRARRTWQEGMRNAEWVNAHRAELEARYSGHWICVAGERVVAVSRARNELSLALGVGQPGSQGRYVIYLPAPGELESAHSGLHAQADSAI